MAFSHAGRNLIVDLLSTGDSKRLEQAHVFCKRIPSTNHTRWWTTKSAFNGRHVESRWLYMVDVQHARWEAHYIQAQ